ncbi:hypothetical protein [Chondromyces apiculatus]|uniref:Uncharacterized protein n=1 Tax=Chondromyces apiculatus DSM 436 TaxID=1192034 RepID=A0A017T0H7_9BACT|nr:hypothetical protein [Chondromyces apiculatus]EYF02728.1 Hypothetical protein CAP_6618 [Chondromyces apiculatus DSM 436]
MLTRLEHEARRDFAQELQRWWSARFPWFVELLHDDDDAEATALQVIEEAASWQYLRKGDILRYSVGYVFFGSRFADNPLHENLMQRCYWRAPVAPGLRVARILQHVDMLTWDGTFSEPRGCLLNIPELADGPVAPPSPPNLASALRDIPARRLVHLDLDALEPFLERTLPMLSASGVPEAWRLRGALLGVLLGWNYPQSPAYAWLIAAMRRDDADTIMRGLRGSTHT